MKLTDAAVAEALDKGYTIEVTYGDGSKSYWRKCYELELFSDDDLRKWWEVPTGDHLPFVSFRRLTRAETLLLNNAEVEFELYGKGTVVVHTRDGITRLFHRPKKARYRYHCDRFERYDCDRKLWLVCPVPEDNAIHGYQGFNSAVKFEISCAGIENVRKQFREIEGIARKAADKMKPEPEAVDFKALYRALGEGKDTEVKFGGDSPWHSYRIGDHGRPQFKSASGQWFMHDGTSEVVAWREKREPIKVEAQSAVQFNGFAQAVLCVTMPKVSEGRRFNVVATEVIDD